MGQPEGTGKPETEEDRGKPEGTPGKGTEDAPGQNKPDGDEAPNQDLPTTDAGEPNQDLPTTE